MYVFQKHPTENISLLILHYQGIGDTILALPMIRCLRLVYQNAFIQVMAPDERHTLFHNTGVNELFSYIDRHRHTHPHVNIVFDLDTGTEDERYHTFVSQISCDILVGFEHPRATSPLVGEVLRLPVLGSLPMWRQYLGLIEVVAGTVDITDVLACVAEPTPAAAAYADELVNAHDERPVVCIAPGSAVAAKQWAAASYLAVARYAQTRYEALVVLLGGVHEQGVAQYIAQHVGEPVLNLAGKTDLGQTLALVSLAQLVVANDSAVLHMAGARSVPAIGLYGKVSLPQQHRPLGNAYTLIYSEDHPAASIELYEVLPYLDRYLQRSNPSYDYWRTSARIVLL
jgi:ADP-heptose:LPS heptosyltransferase